MQALLKAAGAARTFWSRCAPDSRGAVRNGVHACDRARSGATGPLAVRSPADVVAVQTVLGVTEAAARAAIGSNAAAVVAHAGARLLFGGLVGICVRMVVRVRTSGAQEWSCCRGA